MKKAVLFLALPFVFIITLTAQITQEQADEIVINHISNDTKPHTIFAKEEIQADGFTVITSKSEVFELEYSCWVYYVSYPGETFGKYLIVKESNGNLLEVNTKNDAGPEDLALWRFLPPLEINFTEYSLDGTSCQWINLNYDESLIIINSNEELENYIHCTEGTYPEIDFSKHILLLASGKTNFKIAEIIIKNLLQFSINKYKLNLDIFLKDTTTIDETWMVALIVEKLNEESMVELKLNTIKGSVWKCTHVSMSGIPDIDINTLDVSIELTFYPSVQKLEIVSVPLGYPFWGIPPSSSAMYVFYGERYYDYYFKYDYYFNEDQIWWDYKMLNGNLVCPWKITYVSENEIILLYRGYTPTIPLYVFYRFICQTTFNKI